ncbi:MAG: NAD(P)/FAD-dependent oxidoreductase [Oscillospiraceae bacterium]|nr:NAD(P)/FAD-dependent oxidoreductase [Oscillospiraceae bacterium]
MSLKSYDTIIIGGGAAGFAAASFSDKRSRVLIIERNGEPMKKLAITGKGRCNLTNNCDTETILKNITKNPQFMLSSLAAFSAKDTMSFFEELGVLLKTERGGRVFPASDKSYDIVNTLKNYALKQCGVEIVTDRARELIVENAVIKGVKCYNGVYNAPKVIIATGGMSYPNTGSTGDGYQLAAKAGHTITPIAPALVPLETKEDFSDIAGLTLKNVRLSLRQGIKTIFAEQGELLFTHFGVSGPLVLTASCYINQPITDDCRLSIDLKPALEEKTLDNRILRDFSANKNRQLKNALNALLPEKLIDIFVKRSGIKPEKKVNEITKTERRRLLELFKGFELTVTASRPIDEAVITDGGVSVKEINPKTMESRVVKGLHFAGEVIDVMGLTGGFNLQIAFSTAYAAAKSSHVNY